MNEDTAVEERIIHKVDLGDGYTLVHRDKNQTYFDVQKVAEIYNAKYVGEFALQDKKGNWSNFPVSVFYQERIPEQYKGTASNYLGLYYNHENELMVTNAVSVIGHTWTGVLNPETKEILYSAYRHDYQTYGDLMADGGSEYVRGSLHPLRQFVIRDGNIKLLGG